MNEMKRRGYNLSTLVGARALEPLEQRASDGAAPAPAPRARLRPRDPAALGENEEASSFFAQGFLHEWIGFFDFLEMRGNVAGQPVFSQVRVRPGRARQQVLVSLWDQVSAARVYAASQSPGRGQDEPC